MPNPSVSVCRPVSVRPGVSEVIRYPGELAHTVSQAMLDRFLLWAVEQKASDVVLRADDPPWIQVDGRWYPTSEHFVLSASETQLLTNLFSGQEHKAGNVQRGLSAHCWSLAPSRL